MTNATISFEFFPPKTDAGREKLLNNSKLLADKNPEFFSVTFGAGGSTRDHTAETVNAVKNQTGISTAPHISCIGSTRDNILEMIQAYKTRGVDRLVALRGDLPSGMVEAGEFRYANELVSFIREQTADHFHIEVAAYPEVHPQSTRFPARDLQNFVNKVNAGANSAITQYFYNEDAYFRLLDEASKLGVSIPIVPGVMPITNAEQLIRFSDVCGAEIPRWIRLRLESFGEDKTAIKQFGEEVVSRLCEKLLAQQVPGLHFYTLNQSATSLKICENLGI